MLKCEDRVERTPDVKLKLESVDDIKILTVSEEITPQHAAVLQAGLTKLFSADETLVLLDLTGVSAGQDRRDRKNYISAGIELPLGLTYDLDFGYLYSVNRSNDPFYTYRGNHAFSAGISRDF